MKKIITFVVLHYEALNDTIECVDSLMKLRSHSGYSIKIIIVDNGSTNNSLGKLKIKYRDYSDIIMIESKKNIGFSKGNNLGFEYAKDKFQSSFIILINNDTVVYQEYFCDVLVNLYNKYSYAVLGPDIITKNGSHQNPFPHKVWTKKSLRKVRMKQSIKLAFVKIYADKLLNWGAIKKVVNVNFTSEDILETPVHGACLIFSPKYISKFDGLCPDTFLYMEEEILWETLNENDLLSMYSPSLSIFHKEDGATNIVQKSTRSRKINKLKYWIASSYVLERVISK